MTESSHLIELLYDDGSNDEILLCAGHGGAVEPGTAELAVELATDLDGASCWATLGYEAEGSAFDSWHPPSTAIDPDQYPLLAEIADRAFDSVCSIHGLADDEVIVGGAVGAKRKEQVAGKLDDVLSVGVSVATEGAYAGTHPENFVNWLAGDGCGLQVELGPTGRGEEAESVRAVLRGLL
jgi:phage replication-related protein YjqB (UPF0714/DUF867 family)